MRPFSCSPFSSNSYGSSNRSDIETIDDKSFYDNFARFLLKDKRYTSPPGNYICHICYHHGHYIQNCPKKAAHETQTPYQGVKACFGFYKCPKCMRKWTSTKSYAELKQECKKCKVSDYPYKQLRLDVAEGRGLYKKFEK